MAQLRAPICKRLGIEYAVFQAGMGWIAPADLAGAVSAASRLGGIGAGSSMPHDELRADIRRVRELTDKPFGVDILFATAGTTGERGVASPGSGRAPEHAASATVQPSPSAGARHDDSAQLERYTDVMRGMIDVVLDERVRVLIFGLASPAAVTPAAHALGIYVMPVVGTVRHAQKAVADGGDAIIRSGMDGGGRVGSIGTAALIPAVDDAVDAPAIAGGGLADGRGLAAAPALVARGVGMGTPFIATLESCSQQNFKHKIVDTAVSGTTVARAHSGKPYRLPGNSFTRSWIGREVQIRPFPLPILEVGHAASEAGRREGDIENGVPRAGEELRPDRRHRARQSGRVSRCRGRPPRDRGNARDCPPALRACNRLDRCRQPNTKQCHERARSW